MSKFAYLDELVALIDARKGADPKTSHVAKMLKKGPAKIAKKVGEEAVEVAIASTQHDSTQIIYESADLLFHLMLLWRAHGIEPEIVMAELKRREGTSGIEEKANRLED
jgi:phosphoribosyl-ATP pyrophosphohydrolase